MTANTLFIHTEFERCRTQLGPALPQAMWYAFLLRLAMTRMGLDTLERGLKRDEELCCGR